MTKIDKPTSGKGLGENKPGVALKPRDAATLIIVRNDGAIPRILMGKRHQAHAFMPNLFVFPGGKVDKADSRVKPASDFHPEVQAKLLLQMRGKPSPGRARALGMAAVRETFEETGLLIGTAGAEPSTSSNPDWDAFLRTGTRPALEQMLFIARAITPPGRTRRFDSRFFVIDADSVSNLDAPHQTASEELLDVHWLTIAETEKLELAWITRQVLKSLDTSLNSPAGLMPGGPVSFQYQRGKSWYEDAL